MVGTPCSVSPMGSGNRPRRGSIPARPSSFDHPQMLPFDSGREVIDERDLAGRFRLGFDGERAHAAARSEEHTSELQSLMRISYAVFCLKKKTTTSNKKVSSEQEERDNTK